MLIVETGISVVGAQSYVSVEEADAYHAAHGNTSTWAAAGLIGKEVALRKATAYIDGYYGGRYKGYRTYPLTQNLLWPRAEVIEFPEDGVSLPSTSIPTRLKDAVCEAALRAVSGTLAPDLEAGGRVQSVSVGEISQTFFPNASPTTKYQQIDTLMAPLLSSTTGISLQRS